MHRTPIMSAVAALALAGCGSPGTPPTAPAAPECSREALAQPAADAAKALGERNLYAIGELQCDGDWAVTAGTLSSTDNPQMGAPTSFVFRRADGVWAAQRKEAVCGTAPFTTTPPADAAIPAALFPAGCAAG